MKGFSAAAAIVLSTIASVTLFGLQISASWFARFWQGERLTSLLHLLLNVAGAYSVYSSGLVLLSFILAVQPFLSVWDVAFTGLRWLKWLQSWNRGCSFSVWEREGHSVGRASLRPGPPVPQAHMQGRLGASAWAQHDPAKTGRGPEQVVGLLQWTWLFVWGKNSKTSFISPLACTFLF